MLRISAAASGEMPGVSEHSTHPCIIVVVEASCHIRGASTARASVAGSGFSLESASALHMYVREDPGNALERQDRIALNTTPYRRSANSFTSASRGTFLSGGCGEQLVHRLCTSQEVLFLSGSELTTKTFMTQQSGYRCLSC